MCQINLPKDQMEIVKRILRKELVDTEVWVFGSRLTNSFHGGSDLDLALRNKQDLSSITNTLGRIRQAFIDSNLLIEVDVLDWARLPDTFKKVISENYIVLDF